MLYGGGGGGEDCPFQYHGCLVADEAWKNHYKVQQSDNGKQPSAGIATADASTQALVVSVHLDDRRHVVIA